jgi:hypothetical protein
MAEEDYSGVGDTHEPHEAEAAEATDAQMRRTSDHAAIADLAAPSSTYVEAEALAARGKINEILDVLRDAELIPSS